MGAEAKSSSENLPIKMYILVRDDIPLGFVMVAVRTPAWWDTFGSGTSRK